jgi:hypothetical protein
MGHPPVLAVIVVVTLELSWSEIQSARTKTLVPGRDATGDEDMFRGSVEQKELRDKSSGTWERHTSSPRGPILLLFPLLRTYAS